MAEPISEDVTIDFLTERTSFRGGTTDPFAEFPHSVIDSIAQLERAVNKERQTECIKTANDRSVCKGRTSKQKPRKLTEATK